eukprot:CAMPEP_0196807334 /NCGR_PEP_ID=MMETSP1362-20130617/7316_1 /TAXON_ID=163516 /ORGANISM="Leptocylindrus danicus, Strain CCMP1856" /LENGTH=193 /DNA_ID=CAMNT_0042181219 /DNA_START=296 /DNA_END=877 /DNA_ORIENTATION=+
MDNDGGLWTYQHKDFMRGRPELLPQIQRIIVAAATDVDIQSKEHEDTTKSENDNANNGPTIATATSTLPTQSSIESQQHRLLEMQLVLFQQQLEQQDIFLRQTEVFLMQQIQHHRANEEMLQLRRQIDDHNTGMEDMWRFREPIERRIMLRAERNRLLSSRKRSSNNSSDDTNGVNHTGSNQQSCDHVRRSNE